MLEFDLVHIFPTIEDLFVFQITVIQHLEKSLKKIKVNTDKWLYFDVKCVWGRQGN